MWYGKWTFIFVELPRRFMVTLLGLVLIPEIQMPESLRWGGVLACLAFDLLVVRHAPDLRLKRKDVMAKLRNSVEPVFLTRREVGHRLSVIAAGGIVLMVVAYYWYRQGQQPVVFTQLLMAAVLLGVTGYLSALGVPLRIHEELPKGEKPFMITWLSKATRYTIIHNFGYPGPVMVSLVFTWTYVAAADGWEGGLLPYMHIMLGSYSLLTTSILLMPLKLVSNKVKFI